MLSNKGAMFGLDARIALAIFGALSVISGAALYSAIQQSKVISLVTEISEVTKAYEAHFLDTGNHLVLRDVGGFTNLKYNLENLYQNNEAGWKGPYLSQTVDFTSDLLESTTFKESNFGFERYESKDWGDTDVVPSFTCDAGEACSVWLGVTNVNEDIAKSVDEYIDGSAGSKTGVIRLYGAAGGKRVVWYKALPIQE